MASPVFHGLAGAGIAYLIAGNPRRPWMTSLRQALPVMAAGAVLACLPDIDYLPGIGRGYLNTTHQQATHSVAWVLLATGGIWLVGRAWRPSWFGLRAFWLLLAVIGSHLVIDLFTDDRLAPYGIPLGAPFFRAHVRGPLALLPAWRKTGWGELMDWANLRALAIELSWGLVLAAGAVAAKIGWTSRPGPLGCRT